MKAFVVLAASAVAAGAAVAEAATIKQVRLETGRHKESTIGSPVFSTKGVAPLRVGKFTPAYDAKAKIVRGFGNLFTKGPTYNLDPTVDLGGILGEALRSEATAMGFRVEAGTEASTAAWELTGELKDIYTESQQITGYGAMLSYGYMDVQLQVRPPGGERQSRRFRAHSFFGEVPSGFGRKDEAEAGLAHLLVVGSQEILSRLNREIFKAPPHAEVEKRLAQLVASGVEARENDLHLVGLSGTPKAIAPLLQILAKEPNEDNRSPIIDALAKAGSPEVIATLADRYASEDEDCRWYTLKAMDYIGTDAALAVVKDKGTRDEHEPCKRLVKKLLGR